MSVLADAGVFPHSGNRTDGRTDVQQDIQKFAEAALADSKREGLWLAVRARWVALAVIALTLPIMNPHWEVIYYIVSLGLFAVIGWAQLKVGKAGVSRPELFLMFCDLALLTFIAVVPNPWSPGGWPIGMQFRFNTFIYFFVLLATAPLAYSWRTVIAMGTWTAALWAVGVGWVWLQPETHAALAERVRAAVGSDVRMFALIDPTAVHIAARFQEIVVFLIVAVTLAVAVRRSNALLVSHAGIERERTNLARYFSPNVVEQLSKNDEPLKQVRTENVAVLFADIVGFTAYADRRNPAEVIGTLRRFRRRKCASLRANHAGCDRRFEPRAQAPRRAADPDQHRTALRPGRPRRHRAEPARIRRHRYHRECCKPAGIADPRIRLRDHRQRRSRAASARGNKQFRRRLHASGGTAAAGDPRSRATARHMDACP